MIKAMIKKGIVLAGIACIPTAVSMGEFTCRMCTYKCHERKTMIRHLLHKHRVLQCLECGYASKSYNKYQEHLLVKHGKLDCPNCADRTFNSQEELQFHTEVRHAEKSYKHVCNYNECSGRGFPTVERLVVHGIIKHKVYWCWYCKKKVAGKGEEEAYCSHMCKEHKIFVCMKCNVWPFISDEDFKQHKKWHINSTKYPPAHFCSKCNYKYTRVENLIAADQLHSIQHVPLLFFVAFRTIPQQSCCLTFCENCKKVPGKVRNEQNKQRIEAVKSLAQHAYEKHKRCLFCEGLVTDVSVTTLKNKLSSIDYKFLITTPRPSYRLNENTSLKNNIQVFYCEMCGLQLPLNRKSRLFSLSIKTLPFGSGLNEEDHPFYYVKANEEQLAENMMMSVIGEALESEEESRQISKIFSEQKTGGKAIMTDNTKKGSEKYAQSIFKNETKALGNGEEFFYGNADGKADKSDEEKESDFDKSENEVNR